MNDLLTERVQILIKKATSFDDTSKVLQSRLLSVENERDLARSLLQKIDASA